jgi:Uri superfamily endonuclease
MINLQNLPATGGTYVLHLSVLPAQRIRVGRLGQQHFPIGDYFYVGSARGAGGLRARVGRHLRGDGAQHWHIDYLRASSEVRAVLYTVTDTPLECVWSQALAQLPDAFIPVPHFGSSDCRSGCKAHLIAFLRHNRLATIEKVLSAAATWPVVQFRCC